MMEKDFKSEIERLDFDVEQYWKEFDRQSENTDWNKIQENQKNIFAEMLKGELGEDIKKVTSGKVKVKLPFKLKLKYWFENLFKYF